ncbi:MAG: ABC transporter permease subunit [Proteobacteria bacterium]|nr:ABC transporter permease subunit [Pseudomonadota bacterium]
MTRAHAVAATRIGLLLAGFLALEALCRAGIIGKLVMIPPTAMVAEMTALLASGEITGDIVRTFTTIAIAFAGAVALGFVAGAALHAAPRLRRAVDPLLAAYYAVPGFIFYPLLVALFGLNVLPLIAIGLLFAAPAMVIATLLGLDRVPPVLRKCARVHRLGRAETVLHVVLPAAMPALFNGIRLAFAYAFIGVIAGEFILSGGGLGYAIGYAYESFEATRMYGLLLFVLMMAVVLNGALYVWETRLLRRRTRA